VQIQQLPVRALQAAHAAHEILAFFGFDKNLSCTLLFRVTRFNGSTVCQQNRRVSAGPFRYFSPETTPQTKFRDQLWSPGQASQNKIPNL
jgi:hypothetical protein